MRTLVFLIGVVIFCANTCVMDSDQEPEPDSIIYIANNSNLDILFYFDYHYPDTTITISKEFWTDFEKQSKSVSKNSEKEVPGRWIRLFANRESGFKLIFFFFNKDIVNSTEWNIIVENYMILKRYELTLDDLEELNWTITYP